MELQDDEKDTINATVFMKVATAGILINTIRLMIRAFCKFAISAGK